MSSRKMSESTWRPAVVSVVVEQEAAARVGAALHDQQRRALRQRVDGGLVDGAEAVPRSGRRPPRGWSGSCRRSTHRRGAARLRRRGGQRRTALRAEVRPVRVVVTAVGAEGHRARFSLGLEGSRRDREFRGRRLDSDVRPRRSGSAPRGSAYASASSRSSRSVSSSTSSSKSQPSPYGSAFTVSGLPSSSGLTALTVPATGLRTSETLLVDSSSPQASPASTLSPTVGQRDVDDVAELLGRRTRSPRRGRSARCPAGPTRGRRST